MIYYDLHIMVSDYVSKVNNACQIRLIDSI